MTTKFRFNNPINQIIHMAVNNEEMLVITDEMKEILVHNIEVIDPTGE